MVKSENCYHFYFLVPHLGAILCHPVPRAPLWSRAPKFWPKTCVLTIPQAYNHYLKIDISRSLRMNESVIITRLYSYAASDKVYNDACRQHK